MFDDGVAAVEVPIEVVRGLRLKNHERQDSPRLDNVTRSIRDRGYLPTDPIIARVGQRGKWVIVDGGHRLTAAQRVADEFWTNLFDQKVHNLYFLLFETERSWTKVKRPPGAGPLSADGATAARRLLPEEVAAALDTPLADIDGEPDETCR